MNDEKNLAVGCLCDYFLVSLLLLIVDLFNATVCKLWLSELLNMWSSDFGIM